MFISYNCSAIKKKKVWETGIKLHTTLSEVSENNFSEQPYAIHFNIL